MQDNITTTKQCDCPDQVCVLSEKRKTGADSTRFKTACDSLAKSCQVQQELISGEEYFKQNFTKIQATEDEDTDSVYHCENCLSLSIKVLDHETDECECQECFSRNIIQDTFKSWDKKYLDKFKVNYLIRKTVKVKINEYNAQEHKHKKTDSQANRRKVLHDVADDLATISESEKQREEDISKVFIQQVLTI